MRNFLIGLVVIAAVLAGAFYAFSEPDIPRSVLEVKYGATAKDFLKLPDGARAHVLDQGNRSGPAIVLIHGSNASYLTWQPWVRRLGDSYRMISIDLPGHGLTGAVPDHDYSQEGMVKFVKEVTDKLGLAKFALAGNSMGGGVAARYAEEYPSDVSKLILVDAAGMQVKSGDRTPLAFRLARIPVINEILLHITPRSLVTDGLNDAVVRKQIINDRMIDSYWDFARMTGTRQATLERFNLGYDNAVAQHIGDIKAPALILWGQDDRVIPVAAAYKYNKAIPGSVLIVYPGTGHIPQEEVADQSAAAVRDFLK
jgi:pimeloyl-ACP methyl ester carboxylesterase